MIFESRYQLVDRLHEYRAVQIETEPMFYRSSYQFVLDNVRPTSRFGLLPTMDFLEVLKRHAESLEIADLSSVVIDSRSHMLMRGHYPCIPGWHHDDVPRDTSNGQPNYDTPAYHAKHLMAVIDASDQPTGALPEFFHGAVEMPWPLDEQATVYAVWDAHMSALNLPRTTAHSRSVYRFDAHTLHRGTPAKSHGWRWFIRATWDTQVKPENKIRRNANVYVPWSTAGW